MLSSMVLSGRTKENFSLRNVNLFISQRKTITLRTKQIVSCPACAKNSTYFFFPVKRQF